MGTQFSERDRAAWEQTMLQSVFVQLALPLALKALGFPLAVQFDGGATVLVAP
jgi:hypothetical protein